ncbi:immunodominant staphylococcal antigen IsaB family protein [Staphylococcus pasteuri]|uniref:immunodominant staphylococcal antigen IsaB family protein n=1 Tax=Staphylococcus pasteuri TaxID=45972 RepID=UPI001AD89E17|nr:hypothetical protein [Staphylococcus pasteuri]QQT10419.1 hypothetical protein I6J09_07805 [Staphylococcus pasteuri]
MKKTTKAVVGSMLAVGTVFGIGASVETPQSNEAHAATQPYYNYQGHAGNDTSFLLTNQFKNGVKYGNVKFNGKKIVQTKGEGRVNIYDQRFSGVTKSGKSASDVSFDVKDNLSVSQIKNFYGNDLNRVGPPNTPESKESVYSYRPFNNGPNVLFTTKNNKVTNVSVTYQGIGF